MESRPDWVAVGLRLGDLGFWRRRRTLRIWCRDLVCSDWAETASRHGFEVVMWDSLLELRPMNVRLCFGQLDLRSRHYFEVATRVAVWEVTTWIFGVVTWTSHCGQKRGRDMKLMSRHRVVSRRVAT